MRISRAGWALVGASALVVLLLAPATPGLARDVTGPSFPDAATAAASLALLGLASWSLVVAAAIALGASSAVVAAVSPSLVRRALLVSAAGVLAVAPAHAGEMSAPHPAPHTVHGLPLPDRPDASSADLTSADASPDTKPVAASVTPRQSAAVEVRPGDTLWAIAARSLPRDASDAEIARATGRWRDANRSVIGPDPDVIVPAQMLVPPSGEDHP